MLQHRGPRCKGCKTKIYKCGTCPLHINAEISLATRMHNGTYLDYRLIKNIAYVSETWSELQELKLEQTKMK